MAEVIKKLKCKRCQYEWYPRTDKLPEHCPHCSSPYWRKERRSGQTTAQKQEALAGEIQSTINSLTYDDYFNFTSKRLLLAYVTYDDDLTKNPLADLERAKLAIDALAKESRERIEYGKQCEEKRAQLVGEITQFAQDTESAAIIQEVRRVLDLITKLPASLTMPQITEFRNNVEKETRPAREAIAKARELQSLQLKLEVRE